MVTHGPREPREQWGLGQDHAIGIRRPRGAAMSGRQPSEGELRRGERATWGPLASRRPAADTLGRMEGAGQEQPPRVRDSRTAERPADPRCPGPCREQRQSLGRAAEQAAGRQRRPPEARRRRQAGLQQTSRMWLPRDQRPLVGGSRGFGAPGPPRRARRGNGG
jgi:hypothetical protein